MLLCFYLFPVQPGVSGVEAHAGGHHPQHRHAGLAAHTRIYFGPVNSAFRITIGK